MRTLITASFVIVLLIVPTLALSSVGVGVGLGKIDITEELSPGGIYKLPAIPVLNTGDEEGTYELAVTYLADQKERRPDEAWFTFTPKMFDLAPGASQTVAVTMTLPLATPPGPYFAFLEAHPTKKGEGVTIGVAAATKLSFAVRPAGVLGAFTTRVSSFLTETSPASFAVIGVLALSALLALFQKFFRVSLAIKRRR